MRLDERTVVARVERVSLRQLRSWVRRGWVRPARDHKGMVFTEIDLARIELVCQIKDDLNVNDETVPLVLSLMDQVYGLRHALKTLGRAVDRQPPSIRRRIRDAL